MPSVAHEPATLASPRSLLEMHNSGPHPGPLNQSSRFNKTHPPGDVHTLESEKGWISGAYSAHIIRGLLFQEMVASLVLKLGRHLLS